MNQAKLVATVSDRTAISKKDVDFLLKTIAIVTHEALLTGDEVALPNLGKFKTKWAMARTGRNPRTGERLEIPARVKAVFVLAKSLKRTM